MTIDGRSVSEGNRTKYRWAEWFSLAIVILAVVGFALSSPRGASPDESAHQATAWYVTEYQLPPTAEGSANVPSILEDGAACYKFNGRQDASCMTPRTVGFPVQQRILNYPPIYYWGVGLGQQVVGGLWSQTYLDIGGRLASPAMNLAVLLLIALLARRHYDKWGTYLLLIVTPTAAFLWATVNPSGWEISSGLLFAYVFGRAWWASDDGSTVNWRILGAIVLTSTIFALARHSALVWMAGLVLAVAVTGKSRLPRPSQWMVLASTIPGFIASLAWQMNFPARHGINNPDRIDNPQPLDFAHYLMQIDEVLPDRLRQMVGNLGWMDTPVPQVLLLLVLIGWAAFIGFLFAKTRIPVFFLVIGFLGTFVVPSVMEMVRWNDWPYWYQGRITLPFTLPFLLILLMRYGNRGPRAATALSLITGFLLVFMVWQNLMRYSFGIWDYIPERLTDPAISNPAYGLTYLCIALMLAMLMVRLVLLFRERKPAPALTSATPHP
jgi:hypothetical protein